MRNMATTARYRSVERPAPDRTVATIAGHVHVEAVRKSADERAELVEVGCTPLPVASTSPG